MSDQKNMGIWYEVIAHKLGTSAFSVRCLPFLCETSLRSFFSLKVAHFYMYTLSNVSSSPEKCFTADCKSLATQQQAEKWKTTIDPRMNLIIFPRLSIPFLSVQALWHWTISLRDIVTSNGILITTFTLQWILINCNECFIAKPTSDRNKPGYIRAARCCWFGYLVGGVVHLR